MAPAGQLNGSSGGDDALIAPSLLVGLSDEHRKEALAAAAAAKRAEDRAEQRAMERALQKKEHERKQQRDLESQQKKHPVSTGIADSTASRAVFVPKRKRGQLNGGEAASSEAAASVEKVAAIGAAKSSVRPVQAVSRPALSEKETLAVKRTYLGKTAVGVKGDAPKRKKPRSTNKKMTFKFRWDNTDDTYDDDDPLYSSMISATQVTNRRQKQALSDIGDVSTVHSTQSKPLQNMTARDWRIFRENFEITVKGGKSPPPMRSFRESPSPDLPDLHPALLDAIQNVMRFKDPSPIQRQAIPIGLQRRDLIGIAETGSGKTVAFGVPLCHYLLNLPTRVLESVAQEGPLSLIMAPTRELALQIDGEIGKLLSRQGQIKTCAIVGGQSIQQQAQMIRKGTHIIVGTPGRINECIEMAYLVLNQCCYVCLDEADRMIDMGFQPQIQSILDAMGGTLKSENEAEAYQQEMEDLKQGDVARHRLTVMFSATMPTEVEQMAQKYLRHPVVVSIGDKDSSKNKRIVHKIIFLSSPAQKENALREQIANPRFAREKVLVFVNEKKHAEKVGRIVERAGRSCVVLHGGKSQEERETNLETFRRGGVVMVATDVAGRGLDIPDVAHVINYDMPSRSLDSFTHRCGRTARAGKEGYATSFITDEDEAIMAPLKAYLENTGSEVPSRLARHPAASGAGGQHGVMY